jgi:uncharacterized surface protein with fasciclin (FAS1) repeats
MNHANRSSKSRRIHGATWLIAPAVLAAEPQAAQAGPPGSDSPAAQQATADIVDTASAAGSFTTLLAALEASGLDEALRKPGPFTVLAPTDAAFAKLPAGTVQSLLEPVNADKLRAILTYHVVPARVLAAKVMTLESADTLNGQRVAIKRADGVLTIDEARVTGTDIKCTNGVIHVIDSVLMPSMKNIVETASAAGKFKTLLAAAQAGGLVDALQGPGPLTVFAPTDEAFAALGSDTVASLLEPENRQKLVDILKYHVVPGRVFADQAVKANSAKTLQGATIKITGGKTVRIDKAQVLTADIDASNGVIHVIDAVLMPPAR